MSNETKWRHLPANLPGYTMTCGELADLIQDFVKGGEFIRAYHYLANVDVLSRIELAAKEPRDKKLMLKELDDYDWEAVFNYASAPTACLNGNPPSLAGFTREDVLAIVGMTEGENDGLEWVAVVVLKDRRIGVVRAGCDYTGWGCQEGGASEVSESLANIVRFGLNKDDRARLGWAFPEEKSPVDTDEGVASDE